jgi:hypothetical protein
VAWRRDGLLGLATTAPLSYSSGSAAKNKTATITDDLSGVGSSGISFDQPSGLGGTVFASLELVSGDIYVGDLTFPQFSPEGIWPIDLGSSETTGGNEYIPSTAELQKAGINVVIGNDSFQTAYSREIPAMDFTNKSVSGKVKAETRACEEGTPVRLQLKRSTGWKTIEETWLESPRFNFNHLSLKTGPRYRVLVPSFGLGTPVVTTCGKASQKFKLES